MLIKIVKYEAAQIETVFAGANGLWRLARDADARVWAEGLGAFRWVIKKGFVTDMRSGCAAINPIIPKFTGNNLYNAAILVHDANYTHMPDGSNPVSKFLADDFLYEMAVWSGQIGKFRASLMRKAVQLFGKPAYDGEDKGVFAGNGELVKFEWGDR
jgi:hypothetical protein